MKLEMKIAYLILAHKNPTQLARLVGALSGPNIFYIHIDRKMCEDEFRSALQPFKAVVHFSRERVTINWGGFSLVKATLALIRECLAGASRVDRAVLLSGQDYPIKPANWIQGFFDKAGQTEFVQYWELPSIAWQAEDGGMDRIRYYWLIDRLHLRWSEKFFEFQRKIGLTRPLPKNLRIFGGPQWFMLSEPCLRFILNFANTNPDFVRFWKITRCSDEMFFNTIVMNSEFSGRVVNNIYREQDWKKGPEYPRIFRWDDFDVLNKSPNLFARKVDITNQESSALMDRIDQEIIHARD
jgi:hypothetical protein